MALPYLKRTALPYLKRTALPYLKRTALPYLKRTALDLSGNTRHCNAPYAPQLTATHHTLTALTVQSPRIVSRSRIRGKMKLLRFGYRPQNKPNPETNPVINEESNSLCLQSLPAVLWVRL